MSEVEEFRESLAQTIRAYNHKGWSPATSTNYSFKTVSNEIYVSRSGVDKFEFDDLDFILIDSHGRLIPANPDIKPSAETLIHCEIYRMFPETAVILHSHTVNSVLMSNTQDASISFEGYEIQKGFAGQKTHDAKIEIPILENSQDMNAFSESLKARQEELSNHCFIIKKHGTYAWGRNLFEAKRHLETLEYLLEVAFKESLRK